jgi:deoxyguanosine kinase
VPVRPNPFIAIEGPIGVGKTTLARLLQPNFGAELLLEQFEENPFLPLFYADRARYAFQTQVFFLLSRYRQQHETVPRALTRGPLLSDYTFAKDRLFAHLNLRGDELAMYERVHVALAEKIPIPDLVIYLRAGIDVLIERIAIRDRAYERDIDRVYIEALSQAYDGFFAAYAEAPVLVIDTDQLNIVRNPDDLIGVLQRVRAALGQAPFQQSLPTFAPTSISLQAGPRTLSAFQQFHRARDADQTTLTDLYFNFILLQHEIGDLAQTLTDTWRTAERLRSTGTDPDEARQRAVQASLDPLRGGLADCLAILLKLANYAGIDLEAAYIDQMENSDWKIED